MTVSRARQSEPALRMEDRHPITDIMATISPQMLPAVLQVGKRKFVRLVTAQ